MDMFEVPITDQTPEKINNMTFVLLSFLTLIAVFVTDLGLINAVGGKIKLDQSCITAVLV